MSAKPTAGARTYQIASDKGSYQYSKDSRSILILNGHHKGDVAEAYQAIYAAPLPFLFWTQPVMVFWWTGKGYVTALIVFATLCIAGVIVQGLAPQFNSTAWPWAAAFAFAAAINWRLGRRYNAKSRSKFKATLKSGQLLYRARHKFMSLPMETVSLALLGIAIGGAILGIIG